MIQTIHLTSLLWSCLLLHCPDTSVITKMTTGRDTVLGKGFFFHALYAFNRLHISHFPYFLIYTKFCFQQAVFSPPLCDTICEAEGKSLYQSFCFLVCLHSDALKQLPLPFTCILSFSCLFFFNLHWTSLILCNSLSNLYAVRPMLVTFPFSLL